MTHRERALLAIDHKETERVPLAYSARGEAHSRLKEYLDISEDKDLFKRLGVDIRQVYIPKPDGTKTKTLSDKASEREYVKKLIQAPLKYVSSAEEIDNYSYLWQLPEKWDTLNIRRCIREQLKEINQEETYCIIWSLESPGFESTWYLRGYEETLIDFMMCPSIAGKILERQLEKSLRMARDVLSVAEDLIDIVLLGDDLGTQGGLVFSPEIYRKVLKPFCREFYNELRKYDVKIALHSCGSIRPILPDLIEIGLHILNPIQPRAYDMEPVSIKKEFGKDLCLFGGFDIQEILPNRTIDDVQNEAMRLIENLGKGGGFILAPAHSIMEGTPPQNIVALYDTALCSSDLNYTS